MKYMKLVLAASASIFVLTALLLLTCGSRARHSWESAPGEVSVRVQNLVTPANAAHGRSAGSAKAQSAAFIPEISDLRSQAAERPEWGLTANLPPVPTYQEEKPTRLYVIRVVDSVSKDPITHAKVRVEIGDPPKKRNGYTDSQGFFSFTWELTKTHPKSHVSVEAPGYTTIDDFGPLIEDRLIQLTKAKPQ